MNIPLASADPAHASDATGPTPYSAQQSAAAGGAVNDGRWRRWPGALRGAVARVQQWMRSLGPYVAIELLLPGGTIIALALWAYRRRRAARGSATAPSSAIVPEERRTSLRCVTPCVQR